MDVFSDMQTEWVSDYLLNSSPLEDAKVLADTNNIARSLFLSLKCAARPKQSGDLGGTAQYTRVSVPSFSRSHIGAGVCVDSSSGTGAAEVAFTLEKFASRYVVNNTTGAFLMVLHDERAGSTLCIYSKHDGGGSVWTSARLWFDSKLFRLSFAKPVPGGRMDLRILHCALMRSIVSVVRRSVPMAKNLGRYPYRIAENYGAHSVPHVFCAYAGDSTLPMMAFPVHLDCEWKLSVDHPQALQMATWAINDLLQRSKSGNVQQDNYSESIQYQPKTLETSSSVSIMTQQCEKLVR